MFAFMNNKAKADIKVLEFSHDVGIRQYGQRFTEDISSYIDDADNYIVISSAQYITRGGFTDSKPLLEKWISSYDLFGKKVPAGASDTSTSNMFYYDSDIHPEIYLYNDSGNRYIAYNIFNASDRPRPVKFRVVLMRVGDVVSA